MFYVYKLNDSESTVHYERMYQVSIILSSFAMFVDLYGLHESWMRTFLIIPSALNLSLILSILNIVGISVETIF